MLQQNDALNAVEVAALLGVSRNTVYAMQSRGELPSFRIGRKLKFRTSDIEAYLEPTVAKEKADWSRPGQLPHPHCPPRQKDRAPALAGEKQKESTAPLFAVNGTDIVLDILLNYLVHAGITPGRSYMNSYDGLVALYRGQIAATTSCLWDGKTGEYNIPYARRLLPGVQAMVIKLASRSRGFIVKKGNPKKLRTWEDLLQSDLRIANRPVGSGARVLLDEHLQLLDADTSILAGYTDIASSNSFLTNRVARGHADAVIGTERMARSTDGVEFIFLQTEEIDIIIRSDNYDTVPVQALVDVLESGNIKSDIPAVTGYDFTNMGRIVWIG